MLTYSHQKKHEHVQKCTEKPSIQLKKLWNVVEKRVTTKTKGSLCQVLRLIHNKKTPEKKKNKQGDSLSLSVQLDSTLNVKVFLGSNGAPVNAKDHSRLINLDPPLAYFCMQRHYCTGLCLLSCYDNFMSPSTFDNFTWKRFFLIQVPIT